MIPKEPFFLLLDIIGIKGDIYDCALLVYIIQEEHSEDLLYSQKPRYEYICQFSDQSGGNDSGDSDAKIKLRPGQPVNI